MNPKTPYHYVPDGVLSENGSLYDALVCLFGLVLWLLKQLPLPLYHVLVDLNFMGV